MNPALDFETLQRLYVGGMSYGQIAEKQGVAKWSVANKLKRESAKRGLKWPPRPAHKPASRHDAVLSCGVAEYVRDLRKQGIPYTEFARQAQMNPSFIWELVAPNPRRKNITRAKAHEIMKTVEYFERRLAAEKRSAA